MSPVIGGVEGGGVRASLRLLVLRRWWSQIITVFSLAASCVVFDGFVDVVGAGLDVSIRTCWKAEIMASRDSESAGSWRARIADWVWFLRSRFEEEVADITSGRLDSG